MNVDQQQAAITAMKKLFINRDDTYARQDITGSYRRIDDKLDDEVLKAHIDGAHTIGTYQFDKQNNVVWICYDFDGTDLNEQFNLAKILYEKLKYQLKIQSVLLEFSGKKGYHVWLFCEQIDGVSAKYWAEEVSVGFAVHEVFPKQTVIADRYGNLVKLPLGIHLVTGNRSVFYDDQYNQLSFDDSIELLIQISKKKKFVVPKVIIKEIIRTVAVPQGKHEAPTSVIQLINDGVKQGERHVKRFIIVKELYHCGYSTDEISVEVAKFNNNCTPPENQNVVDYHVKTLVEYAERYLAKELQVDILTATDLQKATKIDYQTVIDTYNKWLYLEYDEYAIDLALAVAITRKYGAPLWIIFIAPSGSGKTEIIRPLEDKSKINSTTELMTKITKNTFLSGLKEEESLDFAQTLQNNPKLFLTFDFAQFVKLHHDEKVQIWAQLRDLYDGFLERKSAIARKRVNDIKVNWLICSTPIVDSELIIQQELGTRELLYRFNYQDVDKQKLMQRVWWNLDNVRQMRNELAFVVRKFIEKKESEALIDVQINQQTMQKLQQIAIMICALRAATESDVRTGELENFVYAEMPTRILIQLQTLFKALKNLDENYTDQRAFAVIERVALSSINPIRLRILVELMEENPLSSTAIYKRIGVAWKNMHVQLNTAWQLGLIQFEESAEEVVKDMTVQQTVRKKWFLTEHDVVKYLKAMQDVKNQLQKLTYLRKEQRFASITEDKIDTRAVEDKSEQQKLCIDWKPYVIDKKTDLLIED